MQEVAQTAQQALPWAPIAWAGAGLGLGLAVVGAGIGIGRLAAGVAEGVARQPSAAGQISGATNLPLFLLEGVAILAEVFCLMILLLSLP
jgi:F-type H+-transporting ATPase subunit c